VTRPIDLVLSRLDGFKLRQNGRDRWRACCPAHGGSNASALSVGIGHDDAVLLKCWHGCDVSQVAQSIGLELHELFSPKSSAWSAPMQRRRLLTANQALDLLEFEIGLTLLCASDLACGRSLDVNTRERLLQGAARVSMLRDEVHA